MSKTLLLIGCGQLGTALGKHYLAKGWQVVGARRSISKLPAGFAGLSLDFRDSQSLEALQSIAADYVVVTLTPGERSAEAYQAVFETAFADMLTRLKADKLKRLLFASSTSVYHQNDGSMVDESSVLEPTSFSGRSVLAAECLLTASGLPATVVRFGGIYGGDGLRLAERVRSGLCAPLEPPHYSNRIHRDDCVAVLQHLIDRAEEDQPVADCYLAVDNDPAPIAEVHRWLAEQLGVSHQVDESYRHMAGSKRGNNARLLDSGFKFTYPDYRAGYTQVLQKKMGS